MNDLYFLYKIMKINGGRVTGYCINSFVTVKTLFKVFIGIQCR